MSVDKQLMTVKYDDYDVVEIAENVYKINEYNLTTMFLIVGQEKAVTIDCGTGVDDYLAFVRRYTDLPLTLVVTHAHVDHIGGRAQFENMYLSQADEPIIKDVTTSSRKGYVSLMKFLGFKVRKNKDLHYRKVEKEPTVHYLKEGDEIDLGGKTLKVFETPAHTKGSLSFLLVEDKILFSGDVVNPQCLMFLKHATTLEEMRATYEKIESIPGYETMWASHLSTPISKETFENGKKSIDKAIKRGNRLLPWISFVNHEGFTIIHLANKRKKKKK